MANPTIATEQLLELLLTLKKTTPEAARSILNNQPAIAYALITMMVSMNAVNIEVFQKTLAEFGAANAPDATSTTNSTTRPIASTSTVPVPQSSAPAAPAPTSAIPPHLQAQFRTATPPSSALASSSAAPAAQAPAHTPTPPYAYVSNTNGGAGYAAQASGYGYQQGYQQQGGYGQYQYVQQQQGAGYPGYAQAAPTPVAPTPAAPTPALPESLAGISEEQKTLIMRVLAMTPEQINMLPPADRATYIQIRTTLGVPT